jgi:hypothetical protein
VRSFKLPEDLDHLYKLIKEAFQYPGNPDWNADIDEVEGLKNNIEIFKRIWPLCSGSGATSHWMSIKKSGFEKRREGHRMGLVLME